MIVLFKTYDEHTLEEEEEIYNKYLYQIPIRTKKGIVHICSNNRSEAEEKYWEIYENEERITMDIDKDTVKIILQGVLGNYVSLEEVDIFLENGNYGIIDWEEMKQRVSQRYSIRNHLVPLEVLLFRMPEHCITPYRKLEECLWIDIGNLEVYAEEIEDMFKRT